MIKNNIYKQRIYRCDFNLINWKRWRLVAETKTFPTVIFVFEIQEPSHYNSNGHLSLSHTHTQSSSFFHTPLLKKISLRLKNKNNQINSLSSISSLKATFSDVISLSNTLDCVLNSWNRFCVLVFTFENPNCFLPYTFLKTLITRILSWYWCVSYSRFVQVIIFAV